MVIPSRKIAYVALHVVPWLLLLWGPLSQDMLLGEVLPDLQSWAWIVYFLMIATFYLNYSILVPRLLFKQRFWAYAFSLLGVVGMLTLFHWQFNPLTTRENADIYLMVSGKMLGPIDDLPRPFAMIGIAMIIAVSLAIRLTGRWLQQDRLSREIGQAQLQMELALLKNQVSPHFFFNTLNNVYALTGTDPERAREVIHQLSRIMRHLLYESESTMVDLDREISVLEDYLELNRIRLPERVRIQFRHDMGPTAVKIPPLLFVPFVENAFKHGISTQHESFVEVDLRLAGQKIEFSVKNSLPRNPSPNVETGGLGLTNIQRRLELIYGADNYHLEISKSAQTYEVHLKIPLHANPLPSR